MNLGLAVSAESTRLPSVRATSLSGGSCSFFFTSADCAPAVERPSSQAEASMMRRKSATSSLPSTSGTQISIPLTFPRRLEARREYHADAPARSNEHERSRALIERIVVELVGEVGDEQFCRPVLVDRGFHKCVEAPVARQFRALVGRQERAA